MGNLIAGKFNSQTCLRIIFSNGSAYLFIFLMGLVIMIYLLWIEWFNGLGLVFK